VAFCPRQGSAQRKQSSAQRRRLLPDARLRPASIAGAFCPSQQCRPAPGPSHHPRLLDRRLCRPRGPPSPDSAQLLLRGLCLVSRVLLDDNRVYDVISPPRQRSAADGHQNAWATQCGPAGPTKRRSRGPPRAAERVGSTKRPPAKRRFPAPAPSSRRSTCCLVAGPKYLNGFWFSRLQPPRRLLSGMLGTPARVSNENGRSATGRARRASGRQDAPKTDQTQFHDRKD
jgi:hypothetical protein